MYKKILFAAFLLMSSINQGSASISQNNEMIHEIAHGGSGHGGWRRT